MLYTRKGDNGISGLFGTNERLPKNSPVYEALGTVDELNSLIGLCRARSHAAEGGGDIAHSFTQAQECLFIIQAEIAGAKKFITQTQIDALERMINQVECAINNPHAFVIPGSTEFSALCDYARAVARRAERTVWEIQQERNISLTALAYLNRLSSFLYALARHDAATAGAVELSPTY